MTEYRFSPLKKYIKTTANLQLSCFPSITPDKCVILHNFLKINSACKHNQLHSLAWVFLFVRPAHQQRRQLAVRFYSTWYCAWSRVDLLARRFRLALNRYLFHKVITQGVSQNYCGSCYFH